MNDDDLEELEETEIEAEDGTELPPREAMSLIDLGGGEPIVVPESDETLPKPGPQRM